MARNGTGSIGSLDDGRISFAPRDAEDHEPTVCDPVCGMEVRTSQAAAASEYGGQTYFFCARVCKDAFDSRPEHYARSPAAASPATPQP